ncbi:hypothetical protein B296_00019522, partial [Ensete ventricosum]
KTIQGVASKKMEGIVWYMVKTIRNPRKIFVCFRFNVCIYVQSRRVFCALRGIIRLQALIRGHLVRRQAVTTLHCMWGIVKFQALVRGQRVRLSGIGLEVRTKYPQMKSVVSI